MLKDKIMFKKIFFSILVITIFSCSKKDNDIPSYVIIDNINLLTNPNFGENTENITDIWFYIDDNLPTMHSMRTPAMYGGVRVDNRVALR